MDPSGEITRQSLAEQLKITEWEVEERLKLLNFTPPDIEALIRCHEFILQNAEKLVEEFYTHQTTIPEVTLIIGDADTLERVKSSLKGYIIELFEGEYDLEYVNKRLLIGKTHQRIGVSPKLYFSAIHTLVTLLTNEIEQHLKAKEAEETKSALRKLLMLDLQLVMDTYMGSLVSEVTKAKDKAEAYAESMADQSRRLRDIARKDFLTDLYNHRALQDELRRQIAAARRYQNPLALVYLDLNRFKELNDTHGHEEGDKMLCLVGETLIEGSREADYPCRQGGDEFCIVMPSTTLEQAESACERIIEIFKSKNPHAVSFSIGIVEMSPASSVDRNELMKKADELMYKSKEKSQEGDGYGITTGKIE
ncbi:MAG: GGDEF domain-containing protein [bacterium]|nr:GGDEF domain-containing protein [bacterium]